MATVPTKDVWGPLVWSMLHTTADLSNRRDICLLWSKVLRLTNDVIPCQQCRIHMHEYWKSHTIMPPRWMHLSSEDIRRYIRIAIHRFHNAVNERLGKPEVDLATPPTPAERAEKVEQLSTVYRTLLDLWDYQKTRTLEWRKASNLLIRMVQSGPQ